MSQMPRFEGTRQRSSLDWITLPHRLPTDDLEVDRKYRCGAGQRCPHRRCTPANTRMFDPTGPSGGPSAAVANADNRLAQWRDLVIALADCAQAVPSIGAQHKEVLSLL